MRILIAAGYTPFADDPRASAAEALQAQLKQRGVQADRVMIPLPDDPAAHAQQEVAVRLMDLAETSGNPVDRLIVLAAPAEVIRHPHKIAWLGHTPAESATPRAEGLRECRLVLATDPAHGARVQSQLGAGGVEVMAVPPPADRAGWDRVVGRLTA